MTFNADQTAGTLDLLFHDSIERENVLGDENSLPLHEGSDEANLSSIMLKYSLGGHGVSRV